MAIRNRVTSVSSSTSTVSVSIGATTGHTKTRIKKVHVHFYGGAADAAMVGLTFATREVNPNITLTERINVEHGASSLGPPFRCTFDFGDGVYLPDATSTSVSVSLGTVTNALAAAPTTLVMTIQYVDE